MKIIDEITEFRRERNWAGEPRDLAISISIEANELLENYQWGTQVPNDVNVKEEIADVLIYTLSLVDLLNLDMEEIIREKLIKNAKKYPKCDE